MKKTNLSLLTFLTLAAVLFMTVLSGCNFNLSESKYLTRPDVELIKDNEILINGTYVSSNIDYINIYRQNMSSTTPVVERIAILFPKGDNSPDNQAYRFIDKNIKKNNKYRYYVRFVTTDGEKNRTDWSEEIQPTNGALTSASFAYSTNSVYYVFDNVNHTLAIPGSGNVTAPSSTVIPDIDEYKPALVFQCGDNIRVFELVSPNTTQNVNLKTLLPSEFLNTSITLLGIVGQKTVKNATTEELQSITWTELSPITMKTSGGAVISDHTIEVTIKYGDSNAPDYSMNSDNED